MSLYDRVVGELAEAQIRLVKKGEGKFNAVNKKTGERIGVVNKDGDQWQAKGFRRGPSGRAHHHARSFKSQKVAARFLSGGYDEQDASAADSAHLQRRSLKTKAK